MPGCLSAHVLQLYREVKPDPQVQHTELQLVVPAPAPDRVVEDQGDLARRCSGLEAALEQSRRQTIEARRAAAVCAALAGS